MQIDNLTLLYVEDDRDTQEQMKMLLEDDVKEFYQAFDGEEGLSMYKKLKPDIILSDINMPILDGLSMIQKIKEIDEKQPIIIVSALDDRENLLKSINIGVNFFAPKPIDINTIYKQINRLTQTLKKNIDNKNRVEKLYSLAHYDSLTQVPNRLLFDIKLKQAIANAKEQNSSFKLLFIDLDDFKSINDTYGHAAGDKVLKIAAQRIQKLIKKEDTFSRISGDEFSLIIESSSDESYIKYLLKSIKKEFSSPVFFGDKSIGVNASIGLSSFPQDANSREELLHLADLSMYKEKNLKKGKNLNKAKNLITIDEDNFWDTDTQSFFYKSKELPLTNKERKLLSLLFKNLNQKNSYEIMIYELWQEETSLNKQNRLKTIIKQLRKKLPVNLIQNVFAFGYTIVLKKDI